MTTTCLSCGATVPDEARFCPACGTKLGPGANPENTLLGTTLNGKYRIISELGAGAMGTVYLGEHIGLKKRIALKVLHSDLQVSDESLQRFQREGIAAGQFSHPNAIQIFDFDTSDSGVLYLAMEYVEGPNLKSVIRKRAPLPVGIAVELTRQILSVLAEAHGRGIVHRDLKPDNIMLVRGASGEETVKVLDFGLSKLVDRPLDSSLMTQTGRIMGTPLYMAPEQCSGGEVDHRSDLYAVGLILHEMLSGKPTFGGETVPEILIAHTSTPPPSVLDTNPDIRLPVDLDEFLARALEKKREDRFQSATEMLAALDEVRYDQVGRSARRKKASKPRPDVLRRVALTVLGVILLTAIGFILERTGIKVSGDANVPRVSMKSVEARTTAETAYVRLLDEVRRALRDKDADVALAAIEEAQASPSADSELSLLRAELFALRGEDTEALAEYQAALDADPNYAAAAAGMGWMHLRRADLDAAFERFEAAAELDPDSAEALAGQGAVYFERQNIEQAKELLQRPALVSSDFAPAHTYLGRALLADGDYEPAIAAFIRAKRSDRRDWNAHAGLGAAYMLTERFADAEKELRRAIELEPAALQVRIDLGGLLIERDRFEEALTELSSAVARFPNSSGLHALLGIAQDATDRDTQALQSIAKAVRLDGSSADLQALLGSLYLQSGSSSLAVEHLREALALNPDHPTANLNLGVALLELERFEDARTRLERAVELTPDDPFAHYTLGVLLMDFVGDNGRAAFHFERFQELGGSDPKVGGWLQALR